MSYFLSLCCFLLKEVEVCISLVSAMYYLLQLWLEPYFHDFVYWLTLFQEPGTWTPSKPFDQGGCEWESLEWWSCWLCDKTKKQQSGRRELMLSSFKCSILFRENVQLRTCVSSESMRNRNADSGHYFWRISIRVTAQFPKQHVHSYSSGFKWFANQVIMF